MRHLHLVQFSHFTVGVLTRSATRHRHINSLGLTYRHFWDTLGSRTRTTMPRENIVNARNWFLLFPRALYIPKVVMWLSRRGHISSFDKCLTAMPRRRINIGMSRITTTLFLCLWCSFDWPDFDWLVCLQEVYIVLSDLLNINSDLITSLSIVLILFLKTPGHITFDQPKWSGVLVWEVLRRLMKLTLMPQGELVRLADMD